MESLSSKIKKSKSVSRSAKAGLTFPVARVAKGLKANSALNRVGGSAAVSLTAVIEYIAAEILELSAAQCTKDNRKRITPSDVCAAVRRDKELNRLLSGMTFSNGETMKKVAQQLLPPEPKKADKLVA